MIYYFFKFENRYTHKVDTRYIKFRNEFDICAYIQSRLNAEMLIECYKVEFENE